MKNNVACCLYFSRRGINLFPLILLVPIPPSSIVNNTECFGNSIRPSFQSVNSLIVRAL